MTKISKQFDLPIMIFNERGSLPTGTEVSGLTIFVGISNTDDVSTTNKTVYSKGGSEMGHTSGNLSPTKSLVSSSGGKGPAHAGSTGSSLSSMLAGAGVNFNIHSMAEGYYVQSGIAYGPRETLGSIWDIVILKEITIMMSMPKLLLIIPFRYAKIKCGIHGIDGIRYDEFKRYRKG